MGRVVGMGARVGRATRAALLEADVEVVDLEALLAEARRVAGTLGERPLADPEPLDDALALTFWERWHHDGVARSVFDAGGARSPAPGATRTLGVAFHVDDEAALRAQADGAGQGISEDAPGALVALARSRLPVPGVRVAALRCAWTR